MLVTLMCVSMTIVGAVMSGFMITMVTGSESVFLSSNNEIGKQSAPVPWNGENVLSNSCVGKEDGRYWLQLSVADDSYVPVYLECSNEYVILDISKDNNLVNYFSSFEKWHYAIGGPSKDNGVNWQEWFLPNQDNSDASYLISPDCNTCDVSHERQILDKQTSYYMSGGLFKLFTKMLGFVECDMDPDTYQCYECGSCGSINEVCETEAYTDSSTDYSTSGICGVLVMSSDAIVASNREDAAGATNRPSIGTDGRYCVCYQPSHTNINSFDVTDVTDQFIETIDTSATSEEDIYEEITVRPSLDYDRVDGHSFETLDNEIDARELNIVYLYQKDFLKGTLRIKKSGTYILGEDIEFKFNQNSDEYSYWPESSQNDEYPGAGGYRDPYHMGFFAGIAIEADYVTIDLNGFTMQQSIEFYFQQRWFSLIEFGSQQFLPGQGPSYFGAHGINIDYVTVKNGILGLSSHFGIHGNMAHNIVIEDVHIKDFETHGMQLDGFENVALNNVEIGPSSTIAYLSGDYGHSRLLLPRLRAIETDMIESGKDLNDENNRIRFMNRDKSESIGDIADEMEEQMDMALNYALSMALNNGIGTNDLIDTASEEDKERFAKAKRLYIHKSGIPSASSITGIFLNFQAANTFLYVKYTSKSSSNAYLNNVYIHDISHDMREELRLRMIDLETSDTDSNGFEFESRGTDTSILGATPWFSEFPVRSSFGATHDDDSVLVDFYNDFKYLESSFDSIDANTLDKENLRRDNKIDDLLSSKYSYVGSVNSDAYIAMSLLSDNWDYLGMMRLNDDIYYWAVDGYYQSKNPDNLDTNLRPALFRFGCNYDIMSHSGKGLLGLRLDGVDGVVMNNVRIENLHEKSGLGSSACGEYLNEQSTGGGHFKQVQPMQVGFSGNNLQGLSISASKNVEITGNLEISKLVNDHALIYGVSVWTATDLTVGKDASILVFDISAGLKLKDGSLDENSQTNMLPEACAFRLEDINWEHEDWGTDSRFESKVTIMDTNKVLACNVQGSQGCKGSGLSGSGSELSKTMFGTYDNECVWDTNSKLAFGKDNKNSNVIVNGASSGASSASDMKSIKSNNLIIGCLLIGVAIVVIGSILAMVYKQYCLVENFEPNNGGSENCLNNKVLIKVDSVNYGSV